MKGLYIISGLSIIIDVIVTYISIGIVLAEYKNVYLPLVKKRSKDG